MLLGRLDKAKILLGCGQPELASTLCQTLMQLYEDLEAQLSDDSRLMRESVEPGLSDAYVLAAVAAHAQGKDRQAFALAEAGRARALKYLIAQRQQALERQTDDMGAARRLGIDVASTATARYVKTRESSSAMRDVDVFGADAVLDGRSAIDAASRDNAGLAPSTLQQQFREQAAIEVISAHWSRSRSSKTRASPWRWMPPGRW